MAHPGAGGSRGGPADPPVHHPSRLRARLVFPLPEGLRRCRGGVWLFYLHHLSPRIPNYKLAARHFENELFRTTTSLRLRDSLASLSLRLWDESVRRLIGFRQVGAVSGR